MSGGELAAAFWGIEVRSLGVGPHALRAQRGQGVPPGFDAQARDDGGGARRLRPRRAARARRSRRRPGSTRRAGCSATSSWSAAATPTSPRASRPASPRPRSRRWPRRSWRGRQARRGPPGRTRGRLRRRPPRARPGPGRTSPGATGPRSRRCRYADNSVEATLAPGERPGDPAVAGARAGLGLPERGLDRHHDGGAARLRRGRRCCASPARTTCGSRGGCRSAESWDGRLAVADPAAARRRCSPRCSRRAGIRGRVGRRDLARARCPRARACSPRTTACRWREMVKVVNKESQNLHAEMLLRLVGLKQKGEGSVEKRQRRRARVRGSPRASPPRAGRSRTAPGLSRSRPRHSRRDSPRCSRRWTAIPHAAAFRDSLPIAGVDGTLEKRMRGTAGREARARQDRHVAADQRARGLRHDACAASGSRSRSFVNNHAGRSREAVQALDRVAIALAEAR